ncbi:MAG: arsenate reductase ArsC [Pseudomonadota bacterium]
MDTKTYNVLFIYTHNSARSLMAEAIINRVGIGKFQGFSAGSYPTDVPHPYTMQLLKRLNYDVSTVRSKDWAAFAEPGAPKMDFVFTVCDKAAAETCPIWPGQPMTAHWGVPNPSSVTGLEAERREAFNSAYRMLNSRISIFVNLPFEGLDQLTLKRNLDEIGKLKNDPEPA